MDGRSLTKVSLRWPLPQATNCPRCPIRVSAGSSQPYNPTNEKDGQHLPRSGDMQRTEDKAKRDSTTMASDRAKDQCTSRLGYTAQEWKTTERDRGSATYEGAFRVPVCIFRDWPSSAGLRSFIQAANIHTPGWRPSTTQNAAWTPSRWL